MPIAMGFSLAMQFLLRLRHMRLHPTGPERAALACFNPVFDVVMFCVLLFFWTVISAVVLKWGEISAAFDDAQAAAVMVFVLASYAIMLWRGLGELRDLRAARIDAGWLREKLKTAA
ncbi:MAG: hypothetical protein KIT18_11515 [Burkholderiales bacterium]|nr:hypothetical protein [Burkholderiales bacterium]